MHSTTHEIVEKGEAIYREKLKDKLEKKFKGEIVAIEVESGDYFIGNTIIEAVEKGKEKYPDKIFHAIRIGYKTVYSVGSSLDEN